MKILQSRKKFLFAFEVIYVIILKNKNVNN